MIKTFFSIFKESDNSFDGEENGEKVVLLLRRHPFTILTKLALFVCLFFLPLIVALVFSNLFFTHSLLTLFFFLSSLWLLFVWSGIFYYLTMYMLDVWIITDRRIIDSTQKGFFNRTVSEVYLTRVQDISVQTKGTIETFLRFGNLQIQAAGTEERFNFTQIPDPEKVKDTIMQQVSNLHHANHDGQ